MKKRILLMAVAVLMVFTAMAAESGANHCLKITTPEASANLWDWQIHYKLQSPLVVGQGYTLTMRVKATGSAELGLWPIDTASENKNEWGGSNDLQYLAAYNMTTDWQTMTWAFTAQFPLNELDWVFGKLGGDIFFDDIVLVADGTENNLVANGDFESELTADWEKISYHNLTFGIEVESMKGEFLDALAAAKAAIEASADLTRDEAIEARNALIALVEAAEKFESDDESAYAAEAQKLKEATALLTQWIGVPDSADTNFHIYLCFGQSNMEGNAQPEAQDYENVPERFKVMAAVDFTDPQRTKGEWYTAIPPLCRQGTGLTPADYFGRTMVENLPEEISVGVVHVAVGGTKIEGFMSELVADYVASEADWFKAFMSNYDNDPYARLVEMAKRAQNFGVIKGILMHQGESNNCDATWPEKVKTVYERLLNDLNLYADNVPLLAGEMVRQEQGGICYGHNAVIATLPNVVPTAHIISSEGCPAASDGLHFTAEGYRIIGKRYADTMLELLKNATIIESVGENAATPVYTELLDLAGRRVSKGYKGIVIERTVMSDNSIVAHKRVVR